MPSTTQGEDARIVLELLESVERDGAQSQRRLAADLGVALGLVNSYLKRCVKKGLVKMSGAPARRYMYYLTPQGFAEKSRLTVEYLTSSFSFFRQAKSDCAEIFQEAKTREVTRFLLSGRSDLAEIATICALEMGMVIVAVYDRNANGGRFVGRPMVSSYDAVPEPYDAVIVTDLITPIETYREAVDRLGPGSVLVPTLLRSRMRSLLLEVSAR